MVVPFLMVIARALGQLKTLESSSRAKLGWPFIHRDQLVSAHTR